MINGYYDYYGYSCGNCCGCSSYNYVNCIPMIVGPTGPTGATGPIGPTGATGPTGPTGIVPANFGALMTDADSIELTATPQNVPMIIQSEDSTGVSYTNVNAITIIDEGIYRVDIQVIGSITGDPAQVITALAINNAPVTNMTQAIDFTSLDNGTFTMTNFLTLEPGDQLTIQMNSADTLTFNFSTSGIGAILSVQRVA